VAHDRIPVDLFNPGQVFACLGLLEAASILLGDVAGAFDWSDASSSQFVLKAQTGRRPIEEVLKFLAEAKVSTAAPVGSRHSTNKWEIPTHTLEEDAAFPFPDPASPATLPAVLRDPAGRQIVIDHWGDVTNVTRRDNVKFWAGSGGCPGARLVRDALDLTRDLLEGAVSDPFSIRASQSSSLRFDWRRDYVPLDTGFSLNEHPEIVAQGYPLVEVLAAIGLTNARPQRITKLNYRYAVIGGTDDANLFSPILIRAALGCGRLPFKSRVFHMQLNWPGQENQARCITNVFEEIFE
jgi:CRISPR-associated protein Csb3